MTDTFLLTFRLLLLAFLTLLPLTGCGTYEPSPWENLNYHSAILQNQASDDRI